MKKWFAVLMIMVLCLGMPSAQAQEAWPDATHILLSDEGVTVNGQAASADPEAAVYTARDIAF